MRISDWSSDVCSSDLYVLASALFSFLNRRKHSEREVGEHILVIDEGTTSTRAMLFDLAGKCLATSQRELTQYYPEHGHVEHDAGEILDKTLACAQALVERAGGADRIAARGQIGRASCRGGVWREVETPRGARLSQK